MHKRPNVITTALVVLTLMGLAALAVMPQARAADQPAVPGFMFATYASRPGPEGVLDISAVTVAHLATEAEIEELKASIGVREPGQNYSIIVGGHATGLAAPSEEEWAAAVGSLRIVESVSLSAPASVDHSLEPYFPPVGNQANQGSCASWSIAYYTNGYLQAKDNGWTDAWTNVTAHLMSPAWVYNKVNGGADLGSTLWQPIELLQSVGNCVWSLMPYTDLECTDWGSEAAWRDAPQYRIGSYETTLPTETDTIKAWLAAGYVCPMALDAYEFADCLGEGDDTITAAEYSSDTANHANTIVGYDDSKSVGGEVGAFKIVNSWGADWGTEWGGNGYYWMTYDALAEMVQPVFRFDDKPDYEPSLLGVWELDPQPTRDATVNLGVGNYGSPLDTRSPLWQPLRDGGELYDFPSFMCLDATEFQDECDAGTDAFYLDIGTATSSGTITSFQVEFYQGGYTPGCPTRSSQESPDTPATTPGYVTADGGIPTVSIDDIADFIGSLTNVTGTASDDVELDVVQVQIKNGLDLYWDGVSWQGTAAWVNATGTDSWWYALDFGEGSYTVKARSTDKEANTSAEASDSFVCDKTDPLAGIDDIDDYVNSLASLSGTASDTAPGQLDRVEVQMEKGTGLYWNGTSWQASPAWVTAAGTDSWTYSLPALDDEEYSVRARSVDRAGNISAEASDGFVYDQTGPSVTIDGIDAYVNSLASISGTSSDTAPGQRDKVEVQIEKGTGLYWNGTSWQVASVWLEASGTASWTYSMPPLDDEEYTVRARAVDRAGNVSAEASDGFVYDQTDPSAALDDIDEYVNSLAAVSGTASDTSPGQLDKVEVQIEKGTGLYWDGSSWQASPAWVTATGTTSWTYALSLVEDEEYTVRARSLDMAGNVSPEASDSFVYDQTGPSVTVNAINQYVSPLESVAGAATDDWSGVTSVTIFIRDSSDNTYWDGNSWETGQLWLNCSGTDPWSYNTFAVSWTHGHSYDVTVRALDNAGNFSSEPAETFTIDNVLPAVTIDSIPGFTNIVPQVSGTASDDFELDRVELQVEKGTGLFWNGTSWQVAEVWIVATGDESWTDALPALEDEQYTIRARSVDTAGNVSVEESAGFVYDATGPTVTMNGVDDFLNSLTSVTGSAHDSMPGQLQAVEIQLRKGSGSLYWNGTSWQAAPAWLSATGMGSWEFAMPELEDEQYTIMARSVDMAGNVSTQTSETLVFDSEHPTVAIDTFEDILSTLASITGSASDDLSGISGVSILIQDSSDSTYWDGDSWETAQAWLDCSGTTSWSYETGSIWTSGHGYTVKAVSSDSAGNASIEVAGSFVLDSIPPSVSIDAILDSVESLDEIGGTADDTAPGLLGKVQIAISDSAGSTYWDGSSWVETETWLDMAGVTSWSYDTSSLPFAGGTAYAVRARSVDTAGNISAEASVSFTYGSAGSLFDCGCDSATAAVSQAGMLTGWAVVGLCWGTGYVLVRRRTRRSRPRSE